MASLSAETARLVKAEWADGKGRFSAGILVEGENRIGFLADLTQTIAREGANIASADVRTKGVGRDYFVVEVDDAAHLERLLKALEAVKGVTRVLRSSSR